VNRWELNRYDLAALIGSAIIIVLLLVAR